VLRSGEKWRASSQIEVIHKNGFRAERELGALFAEYAYEIGVNYGRFARRGDWNAAWTFVLEQCDHLRVPAGQALRLRRPRGVRTWISHARGFVDGIRLPSRLGYVDGDEIRRMEMTGRLDREAAPEALVVA
jgi:hypothetical protein